MWPFVVVWVLAVAASLLLAPKPKTPGQKPAGIGDFTVPTAEIGREIPVLFGTRDLGGPNVVWYGDLQIRSVK